MGKNVRYVGSRMKYAGANPDGVLERDKLYEVKDENVKNGQRYYTLKGVEGEFHDIYFREKTEKLKMAFLAVSSNVPAVGRRCKCSRLEHIDGRFKLVGCVTGIISEVLVLDKDMYYVKTGSDDYVVQVV